MLTVYTVVSALGISVFSAPDAEAVVSVEVGAIGLEVLVLATPADLATLAGCFAVAFFVEDAAARLGADFLGAVAVFLLADLLLLDEAEDALRDARFLGAGFLISSFFSSFAPAVAVLLL